MRIALEEIAERLREAEVEECEVLTVVGNVDYLLRHEELWETKEARDYRVYLIENYPYLF